MKLLRLGIAALSVPLALVASPASADGNATGGGWDPGTTFQQSDFERSDLANKMADADYEYRQLACQDTPDAPCPNVADTKIVSMAHVAQSTNFYCGPAAGTMILRATNQGPSAYNGRALNQSNVADDDHMRTDANGKTAWDSGLFRRGLNRWRGDTFYANLASPSNKEFRQALLTDIKKNIPFGASTLENAGGSHYNFHPNATIGHWIVALGWKNKLDNTVFDDPAANSSALSSSWSNVAPTFTTKTNTFNQNYVTYHGITF